MINFNYLKKGKLPLDKKTFDKFNKVSKNKIKTD